MEATGDAVDVEEKGRHGAVDQVIHIIRYEGACSEDVGTQPPALKTAMTMKMADGGTVVGAVPNGAVVVT